MPELLDVSPTRGTLLELRDNLDHLRQGHDLLDRKRKVLVQKLFDMIADAENVETTAREHFADAHEAVRKARMHMGVDRLRWISLAPMAEVTSKIRSQSIMGVEVPLVSVNVTPLPLPYGPADTSVALDEARAQWLEVATVLGELAETIVTVWRLATELRKTQRRVNALADVLIPRYEATVAHIEQLLEEDERETIVHAKKVKALHEAPEEDADD